MKVAQYIYELLNSNECVIVPGFGGFVTNYSPAKIHPVNHTFYPPSKSVLFNSKLTTDDGLLLHSISVSEGITYEESKNRVDDFIHDCHHDLNKGQSVKLEKLGTLMREQDGRYLFEQDTSVNFLAESFGLSTFISPPVLRTPAHKRMERKFTDRKPRPAGELKNKKIYYTSVVLVPVLLFIGWIIIAPEISSWNSQESSMVSLSNENQDNNAVIEPQMSLELPSSPKDTMQGNTIPIMEQKSIQDELITLKTNNQKLPGYRYYIIGGAFKSRDNADKLLSSLKNEGYAAEDAGQNAAGLFMVSYFSSDNKPEALSSLGIIRRDKNPSAWLLKK